MTWRDAGGVASRATGSPHETDRKDARAAFLKICGITREEDALHAAAHGATALGFVFWRGSPRYVAPARAASIVAAVPPHVTTVGVFVNEPLEEIRSVVETTGIAAVQLHGDESPEYAAQLRWPVLRAMRVDDAERACPAWPRGTRFLLDAVDSVRRGGTGTTIDWDRAAPLARSWPVVLAGGLSPLNVAAAIAAVGPLGVDVSSGVEEAPGIKDPGKVAEFLANARGAFDTR